MYMYRSTLTFASLLYSHPINHYVKTVLAMTEGIYYSIATNVYGNHDFYTRVTAHSLYNT